MDENKIIRTQLSLSTRELLLAVRQAIEKNLFIFKTINEREKILTFECLNKRFVKTIGELADDDDILI